MDNITHSLTGLAMARAGLGQLSPRGTALLVVSANIPDIDFVAALRGSLVYLENHRGYTHSLVGLPAMALLSLAVVAFPFRRKLPWATAFGLCCLGVASHLLLDWTNSYGVRWLLPFSSGWSHLDLNGLYDWVIIAVLAFAAVWPLFARLVSDEIGARRAVGRGLAVAALIFFLLFDVARSVLHSQAVAKLDARLYDGAPPLRTAALPDSWNPLRWTGVVETERSFELFDLNALREFDIEAGRTFYKPAVDSALLAVKRTEPFRYFSYFARFPVWRVQHAYRSNEVLERFELSDLRFGTPGAGAFHCIATLDSRGKVLRSQFTFRSGADLDWR